MRLYSFGTDTFIDDRARIVDDLVARAVAILTFAAPDDARPSVAQALISAASIDSLTRARMGIAAVVTALWRAEVQA